MADALSLQDQAAQRFHALHQGSGVLVLANAWDAVSARVVEEAGALAAATSSAALAWAHGYRDGHGKPFAKLLASVEEIARVISVPLSVDAEAGYADAPEVVGAHIAALIGAGAVGINLEDGSAPHETHLRNVEAARNASERAGVALFINARTDVFLQNLTAPEVAVEESIKRGRALAEAGASGLFVPGISAPDDIAAIAAGVALPLNVLAWKGLASAAELARLGVRRLSAGAVTARLALAALKEATEEMLMSGDSARLLARAGPGVDYNQYFRTSTQSEG
jgi:2-methylisocitrate lyase-like PEP mutase family enzyme